MSIQEYTAAVQSMAELPPVCIRHLVALGPNLSAEQRGQVIVEIRPLAERIDREQQQVIASLDDMERSIATFRRTGLAEDRRKAEEKEKGSTEVILDDPAT